MHDVVLYCILRIIKYLETTCNHKKEMVGMVEVLRVKQPGGTRAVALCSKK